MTKIESEDFWRWLAPGDIIKFRDKKRVDKEPFSYLLVSLAEMREWQAGWYCIVVSGGMRVGDDVPKGSREFLYFHRADFLLYELSFIYRTEEGKELEKQYKLTKEIEKLREHSKTEKAENSKSKCDEPWTAKPDKSEMLKWIEYNKKT